MPILECEEAAEDISAGDEVSVDFKSGVITNHTRNRAYQAQGFPEFIQKIMEADGLVAQTRAKITGGR